MMSKIGAIKRINYGERKRIMVVQDDDTILSKSFGFVE
jgi:hypothetical protein